MRLVTYLTSDRFNPRGYLGALAVAIAGYYVFARLLQDWLYAKMAPWPAKLDVFPPLDTGAAISPEPFEIPLYVFGYVVIPAAAFGVYWLWVRYGARVRVRGRLVMAALAVAGVVGVVFALQRLDVLSLFTYLANRGLGHALWLTFTKRLFVARIALAGAAAVFGALAALRYEPALNWVSRFNHWPMLRRATPWFLFLMAVLVFTPNFPYEQGHYNYVIGTVNDMLHGKTFLYETTNQYGILNIYLAAFVFKYVFPLGYGWLSLLFAICLWLFYAALFFVIRRWLRSDLFAYLGTFGVVTVNYLLEIDPFRGATIYPGPTPFRQGFFVVVLLALLAYLNRRRIWTREVLFATTAAAVFWNIDTGLYALVAVFGVVAYLEFVLHRHESWKSVAFAIGGRWLHAFGYVAAFFAALTVINYAFVGAWPHWSGISQAIFWYESGYGRFPLPIFGLFEAYVLVYLSTFLWLVWRVLGRREIDAALLFVTLFGIFSFLYYVGTSAWNYFAAISVPLILIIVWIMHSALVVGGGGRRITARAFVALTLMVVFLFAVKVPVEFSKRDYSRAWQNLALVRPEDEDLYRDAQALKRMFPQQRLAVFHVRDAKLLIFADKTNALPIYDNFQLVFRTPFNRFVQDLLARPPEYLIVSTIFPDERVAAFRQAIEPQYVKVESLRTLDIYRRPST
ncbi:hypothetical protein HY442_00590 [Candidatus Parcubacteria bacterium]|nr:hypothetical protein [Candidatus Parcubacteria bacterium]MBI4385707.1 hypothetical protein [Candidatus Parcubacteria bacterium]